MLLHGYDRWQFCYTFLKLVLLCMSVTMTDAAANEMRGVI